MKNLVAGVIALLIAGTGAYPQEMTEAQTPIMEFASFAEDKQLEINAWTITVKEKLPAAEVEEKVTEIDDYLKQPEFTKEESVHSIKYTFKNTHKDEAIVEHYILIVPKNKKNRAEMVYTMDGRGKSSLTKDQILKFNEWKSRFFSKNVTIFSCLKAKSSDIIDDVLVYQKFKQAFNITTIEEVDENGWTSRSGYTNEWEQSMPTGSGSMNVQFASRTLGDETNITIGTPIITAEY